MNMSWYSLDKKEFQISSGVQLFELAELIGRTGAMCDNFEGKTIALTSDIDLIGLEWTPIGFSLYSFRGSFDGGGHTIANLTITGSREFAGLFGHIRGANIRNVHLTALNIFSSACSCAGGLVGLNDGGTIRDCTTSGRVSFSSSSAFLCAGGLVGRNDGGTIRDCAASASVSASSAFSCAGGLVGLNYCGGTIRDCTASGSVSSASASASYAGGLVGLNCCGGTITSCAASGKDIDSVAKNGSVYRGGFIGQNFPRTILAGNRNETGVTPAMAWDCRSDPPGPGGDI
jgi:hypothetical protein